MTLGQKQRLFAKLLGQLLAWIYANGYECSLGEALRTPEQAMANAASGAGIAHSLHLIRLAIDLNLFKDGVFLKTVEEIRPVGEFWKTLDPLCSWGGDFTRPDADHFSLSNEGIR